MSEFTTHVAALKGLPEAELREPCLDDLLAATAGLPDGQTICVPAGLLRIAGVDIDPEIPDERAAPVRVDDVRRAAMSDQPPCVTETDPPPSVEWASWDSGMATDLATEV